MQFTPLFLGIVIGITLSLIVVIILGVLRSRTLDQAKGTGFLVDMRDELLIGLLVLAAFGLGAFLTYILLSLRI
ncbi:MAG: hypothetical protein ACM3PY_02170 [Omnitrophica WOR_2 bacterium]